jgi:hypothetical protein
MPSENKTNPLLSAIGLETFYDASLTPAIRLSLSPSLHPRVCITIDRQTLACAALESRYSLGLAPAQPVVFAEMHAFSELEFNEARIFFDRAADEHAAMRKNTIVDGIGVSALLVDGDSQRVFHGNLHKEQQTHFALTLIRAAHAHCKSPHLLNRIAECAYYFSEKIPLVETISAAEAKVLYDQWRQKQIELIAAMRTITDASHVKTHMLKVWEIHWEIDRLCGKIEEYVAQHREQSWEMHQKLRADFAPLHREEEKESKRFHDNVEISKAIDEFKAGKLTVWSM